MKKPIKYLIAVLICCISTALLVFGVYSARQISYSLSGTINYEVNTLYTDVTTSLYALNLPFEQNEVSVNSKMYQLQNSLSESKPLPQDVVKISDLNNYSTMGNGISTENTLTASEKFSINYGDYIQDSQVPTSPAFYLVFEVKNYSSATISALLDLTNLIENTTNTLTNPTITKANIYGKTTGQEYSTYYFLVELSFDKHSILKTSNFDNITFTVNAGELVATPQSQFTFSTSGDTATITKYNGTDTDVVIPSHLEDGKTVTTIDYNAFRDNTTIKSVYIPDTIKSLYNYAFYDCTNLTIVDIQGRSLSSIGDYAFRYCSSLTSINMPKSVESIGNYAFNNCSSLTSVTIPESVESIGSSAFDDCSDLKEVNYLGSVNDWLKINFNGYYSNPLYYGAGLYIDGKLLTEITEDDFVNITTIKSYAFHCYESLISVTMPNSVESIGFAAFEGCNNIKEVNYLGSVNDWLKISFGGNSASPLYGSADLYMNGKLLTEITEYDFVDANGNKTTKINSYAFDNCGSLISVTIPECVESMGESAFSSCSNLRSITLKNKSIGETAFNRCVSLTSITMLNSVKSIERLAFQSCDNLKEVHYSGTINDWLKIGFGDDDSNPVGYAKNLYINGELLTEVTEDDFVGLTAINSYAFHGCKSLTSITIPESVESIGSYAFYNCDSLTSVTIPNSVTSIGSYAFQYCDNLKEVTLPTNDSFKTINSYTFSDCSSLTSITIPNSVTSIGSYAFHRCTSLTSITIPSNVTSIGNLAFFNCTNLKLVFNLSNIDIVAGNSSNGYVGNYAEYVIDSPNPDNFYDDETWQYYKTDDGTIITLGYTITIPDGTTSISQSLVTSLLPEGVSRSDITKVIIPSSVTNMGSSAFSGCSDLEKVNYLGSVNDWLKIGFGNLLANPLNEGANLYINGNLLTEVKEDDFVGLTAINFYVFYGCESLTSITIPNSVTSIGSSAFYNCKNLREITLPTNDSFKTINSRTFYGCSSLTTITIPNNVTSIGSSAFYDSGLTSITIPNSVTSIGSSAFYSCNNLKEVNFIGSVNDWLKISFYDDGANPLYYAKNLYINGNLLTEITEDDFVGLTEVKSYAFYGCESLLSVTIPNTIESIGSSAFSGCTNLKEVHYLGTINDWLKISFTDVDSTPLYNNGAELYINGKVITEITEENFKNSDGTYITKINNYAFNYWKSLTNITIPESVESIGSYAFYRCTSLKEVTLPANDSFKTINDYTFAYCSSLTSITIPNSITSIGSGSFYYCNSLYRVIIESETVLKGLTSSSSMGALISYVDDSLDRIYVLKTMEASIPDYIKSNWVQLKNTETVDGKEYIIFRHA